MIENSPNPLPDEVRAAARRWEARENSLLYAFILDHETHISRSVVLRASLDSHSSLPAERVDVVLESLGGDIEAAYKFINHLRAECNELRVFVPDYAKSAASFLTLGADSIHLGPDAELGPLDAQIRDPRHPDRWMAALEHFGAVDYLRQYGYETLDQFVRVVVQCTRMNVEEILKHAVEYTTKMMQALYSQVDPLEFGGAHRALTMSEEYGQRMMKRYGYSELSDDEISEIVHALTWDYPSHSFVIDYDEAAALGLNVERMTAEQYADAFLLTTEIQQAIGYFGSNQSNEEDKEEGGDERDRGGRSGPGERGEDNGQTRAAVRTISADSGAGQSVAPTR